MMYNTKPVEKAWRMTQEVLVDASRQVWLAGLGAVGLVGDTSVSTFDSLVREGEKLQAKQNKKVKEVRKDVTHAAQVQWHQVESQWKQVEETLQHRVTEIGKTAQDAASRTLKAVGLPTSDDVAALNVRLDRLRGKVDELGKPARKAVARKPRAVTRGRKVTRGAKVARGRKGVARGR